MKEVGQILNSIIAKQKTLDCNTLEELSNNCLITIGGIQILTALQKTDNYNLESGSDFQNVCHKRHTTFKL